MTAKMKIMLLAIKNRMKRSPGPLQGEDIDDILDSYPKLTDSEKKELKEALGFKED